MKPSSIRLARGPGRMIALFIAVVGIFFTAGVAWGAATDNLRPVYGGPGEPGCTSSNVCQTDNAYVTYWMAKNTYVLEQPDREVVVDMLRTQYAPTQLSRHYDENPTFSGSGETDILYREGPVPGSNEGYTYCNDTSPSPKYACDQQYVTIQGGGHYSQGLSCHETGHAVGLVHGRAANPELSNQASALHCMKKTVDRDDVLGSNNRENINETY